MLQARRQVQRSLLVTFALAAALGMGCAATGSEDAPSGTPDASLDAPTNQGDGDTDASADGDAASEASDEGGDASIDGTDDTSADAVATDASDASDSADSADSADAADASDASDAAPSCTLDQECSTSSVGPYCHVGDGGVGACVACTPAGGCSVGEYCTDALACATGCAQDQDCAPAADAGAGGDAGASLHCDPTSHQCVGCIGDADCQPGSVCDSGSHACVAGCNAQHLCASGKDCCGTTCFDLQKDVTHCGQCDTACPDPVHGKAACTLGVCGLGSCTTGFLDCDSDPAACEVNSMTDLANCGGCLAACAPAHATGACDQGVCTVATCATGHGDCNHSATDGCEDDTTSDVAHCGSCLVSCSVAGGTAACVDSACAVAACNPSHADCNLTYADGCEANTDTSPTNCGLCGTSCTVDHATAGCAAGVCTVATCTAPFLDCDGKASNGCEIDPRSDAANCATCDNACLFANAGASCAASQCQLGACQSGFDNCDNKAANGCETDLQTSVGNCGACNNACNVPNATPRCIASSCEVGSCLGTYHDCNDNSLDGCEIDVATNRNNCGGCGARCSLANVALGGDCVASACKVTTCSAGFADCNTTAADGCEIDMQTDANHCGHCDVACTVNNGTPACASSACKVGSCKPGFEDCNSQYSDGCETDTTTSLRNCGGCGTLCAPPNATAACGASVCSIASCTEPFKDCNGKVSDGCEIDTHTLLNCGGCGAECAPAHATASCSTGACTYTACDAGYTDCNGVKADGCEVHTDADVTSCGTCGNACAANNATPTCTGGACKVGTCDVGFADCDTQYGNGCEKQTRSDPANCGACFNQCSLPHTAVAGCAQFACTVVTCADGYADCDGVASNGCETSTHTLTDCGGCGVACDTPHGAASCTTGVCKATCDPGWTDCINGTSDGCETNTAGDVNHCGTCTTVCPSSSSSTPSCVSGVCGIASCTVPGTADCNQNLLDGCETTIHDSVANCGGCGTTCSVAHGTPKCTGVACGILSCDTGFADCKNGYADGCETPTTTLTDCGTCGQACSRNNATATCADGTCDYQSCNAGWGDCDGNRANGCETNLNADVNNCGACKTKCDATHGTATCNGSCDINCTTGYSNCDGNVANGCEKSLYSDVTNCLACGNVCPTFNGTPSCSIAGCAIGCAAHWGDCNSAIAGCETPLTTTANCNGCGVACTVSGGVGDCSTGACTIASCNAPYKDCKNGNADGCETNSASDPLNCGGCGAACNLAHATAGCANSACTIAACASGYTDCDGLASTGCEVNTGGDVLNCGGCGTICSTNNIARNCNGACNGTCNTGFGDCNSNKQSDGCEVNLTSNVNNCAVCGHACTLTTNVASTTCSSSACQVSTCTVPDVAHNLAAYDMNGTYSDGCECTEDATPNSAGSATSLGTVNAGQTLTVTTDAYGHSLNLGPSADVDWFQVSFGNNNTCGFTPKITLNDASGQLQIDVNTNTAGATMTCGAGETPTVSNNVTAWEFRWLPGCLVGSAPSGSSLADPSVSPAGPTTYLIRVHRKAGAATNFCGTYTLTIKGT